MTQGIGRPWGAWLGPAVVLFLALTAALAVVVTAHEVSAVQAEGQASAAAANAVVPVEEELRTARTDASAGTLAGGRMVAIADAASADIATRAAIRARDSGEAVLDDSGGGVVVVAAYDTGAPPATVEERRSHATGLQVYPLELLPTLRDQQPLDGGIALAGPERQVLSLPDERPEAAPTDSVSFAPGPATQWTLTVWTAPPSTPLAAWATAAGFVLAGIALALWLLRREQLAGEAREKLSQLQDSRDRVTSLATVAQHSLDLADLLPAITIELSTALGLRGLAIGMPIAEGERLVFAWGEDPDDSPATVGLPPEVSEGDTISTLLSRGGRTVASLRIVAGRQLTAQDMKTLDAAVQVLTSAIANAEAFAQQRELMQRMRAVDELKTVFLATASHELRTPVGAITGYARILASDWDSIEADKAREYAQRVDSNAQRLRALVEDLLDFSRLERGIALSDGSTVLDLGEVVNRMLDEQPDLAPDHQVTRKTISGLRIRGSVQAVERVVSNLVGNAAKYSPAGSTIRVLVEPRRGRVELIVDDEGPGVPSGEREQIFSRFFRGTADAVISTRGAGLGLAIVNEFASAMDGRVSVHSAPSGGARFVVSYPQADPVAVSIEGDRHVVS